jgi:hypothetical protein
MDLRLNPMIGYTPCRLTYIPNLRDAKKKLVHKSVHIKIAMEFGADESPLDTAANLGRNGIRSRPMKDRTVPHEPYRDCRRCRERP